MAYEELIIPDYSKWNAPLIFATIEELVLAGYLKASEATTPDPTFATNKAGFIRLGKPWGGYHFFRANYDISAQVRLFALQVVGSQLKPALDVESRPIYMSRAVFTQKVLQFVKEFMAITGRSLLIYTRANWWDTNTVRSDIAMYCDVWLAQYNLTISVPEIPLDWKATDNWIMHQFSADGNGEGAEYGASSNSVDKNRFRGGKAAFYIYYPGVVLEPGTPPPPEPPPPPTGGTVLAKVMRAMRNTNVRNNIIPSAKYGKVPGVTYPASSVYFTIPAGQTVEVIEEKIDGHNTWGRVGQRQWMAIKYDDVIYLV